jgi:phosphoglycerate kinase
VAGISKYLPTYFGFLVKEEIENLNHVIKDIKKPFTVFMGGAKVDDKLGYIKGLLPKCDYLLLGGGIASSFLYALGYDVGESLCTNDELTLEELRYLYKEYEKKIILPVDFVIDNNMIFDLGEKSINKYIKYFKMSNTIFINGTAGKFEEAKYAKGTKDLFTFINRSNAFKIAGGGDTITAINKFNLAKNFNFLSSGGGASLEYISTDHLQAVDFIEENSK